MKKNNIYLFKVFGIVFLCLCIFAVILFPEISRQYEYNQAENLIAREEYNEALSKLEKIEKRNIKDTKSLMLFCEAQIKYSYGDIEETYYKLKNLSFNYQTKEQLKKIDTFKKNVEKEYEKYINEEAKKESEKRKNEIKNGVPFVGMSESEIGHTSLGKPSSEVRHNKQMVSGKVYTANLYDFKVGTKTIFTVRCVQGKVTEVWDKRNEQKSTYIPSTKKKTKRKKNDDPYNAKDYYDAEDFYDDYEDEFYDFEEAEEYYNEHSD